VIWHGVSFLLCTIYGTESRGFPSVASADLQLPTESIQQFFFSIGRVGGGRREEEEEEGDNVGETPIVENNECHAGLLALTFSASPHILLDLVYSHVV
jgi:hypothetical protein